MSDPQEPKPSGQSAADTGLADRTYRSGAGVAAGVLLVALTVWLCADTVFQGHDTAPLYGLAAMLLLVPLFLAFTILPVVRANPDRLYVRNPFRIIRAPWGSVESIQAALSVELLASGKKYQVWAVPVSLRQRKRAGRRAMIAQGDRSVMQGNGSRVGAGSRFPVGGPGLRSRAGMGGGGEADVLPRAVADRTVDELRELATAAQNRATAVGPVAVTWAWWIIAPVLAGAVMLAVLAIAG